jgi:hypothetical protein
VKSEAYRTEVTRKLFPGVSDRKGDSVSLKVNLKTATWQVVADFPARALNIETRIQAVERVPLAGRGKAAQFVPIRFAWANKVDRDEKLLLAYDALVLSQMLGRDVLVGKIVHGQNHAVIVVKVADRMREAKALVDQITALLFNQLSPDTILQSSQLPPVLLS